MACSYHNRKSDCRKQERTRKADAGPPAEFTNAPGDIQPYVLIVVTQHNFLTMTVAHVHQYRVGIMENAARGPNYRDACR